MTKDEIIPVEESKTIIEKPVVAMVDDKPLIPDEKIVALFEDTISDIREDRKEANERYLQFADLVINQGESSSATKEAMVNLLKIKSDAVNQSLKVLDLWTRMKLKDKSTSSQVYAYQQNNKYEVNGPNPNVRKLIRLASELEKPES